MRTPITSIVALALAASAISGEAFAGNGKGKHKQSHQSDAEVSLNVDIHFGKTVFTEKERRIVREYYRGGHAELPPGLAKRKSLPPGLKKQLRKTGHLPPGLEKRRMPSDLVNRLPRYDGPFERTIIGNDLILLDPKTGLILDVMQEIFDVPVDETLGKVGARRISY